AESQFSQNSAGTPGQTTGAAYGGAISVRQGDIELQSTKLLLNLAWGPTVGRGGAVAIQGTGGLRTITDSRFDLNDAVDQGGAVFLQCNSCNACNSCEHDIQRNTFDSNRSDFGAAVRIDSSDFAPVALAYVANNTFLRSRVRVDHSLFGSLSIRNTSADVLNNSFVEDNDFPLHPSDISAIEVFSPLPSEMLILDNLFGRRAGGTTCTLFGDITLSAEGNFGP